MRLSTDSTRSTASDATSLSATSQLAFNTLAILSNPGQAHAAMSPDSPPESPSTSTSTSPRRSFHLLHSSIKMSSLFRGLRARKDSTTSTDETASQEEDVDSQEPVSEAAGRVYATNHASIREQYQRAMTPAATQMRYSHSQDTNGRCGVPYGNGSFPLAEAGSQPESVSSEFTAA